MHMAHDPIAFENQIVAGRVDLGAEDFDHPPSTEIHFLKNLGNERVFDELLEEARLPEGVLGWWKGFSLHDFHDSRIHF